MLLTDGTFFWISGIIIAILLGFLIPILVELTRLRGEIKPISSLVNDVDGFFRKRGINALAEGLARTDDSEHHSLPPEKAAERDALTEISKVRPLNPTEASRLKELLEEDARDELGKGVVSLLAFALIMTGIAAIIKNLSKE